MILSLALFVADAWNGVMQGTDIIEASVGTYLLMLLGGALFTVVMGFVRKGKQPMMSALVHSIKTLVADSSDTYRR